jgi:hypothetical protein
MAYATETMEEDKASDTTTLEYQAFRESYQDTSRSRGFLTKKERKFILGELDIEGQQARNTRYRIRQHTIEAFLDIALLNHYPELDDIEQIAGHERIPLHLVTAELIGAAYTLCLLDEDTPDDIDAFEDSIERALKIYYPYEEAEDEDDMLLHRSVSVDIGVNDLNLEDVESRIQAGEATQNEMRSYYQLAMSEEDFGCDEEIVDIIEPMMANLTTLSEMGDEK